MMYRLLKTFILNAVFLIGSLHAGLEFKWGLSARQGKRPTMEDRHVHFLDFGGNKDQAFFGVYDGHGVSIDAARFTQRQLHNNFLDQTGSPEERLKAAIKKTDEDFLESGGFIDKDSGTTAVVAFIEGERLHLGWLADSRAVLERQGGVAYATEDHKPFTDKARIEETGYQVIARKKKPEDEPFWTIIMAKKEDWDREARDLRRGRGNGYKYYFATNEFYQALNVFQWINVSRSIGNQTVKEDFPGVLTNEADVESIDLTRRNGFLILACDGVWDEVSNEEAVNVVRDALAEGKTAIDPDPRAYLERGEEDGNDVAVQYAARALRDKAFKKGSIDNISVIVVKFDWTDDAK